MTIRLTILAAVTMAAATTTVAQVPGPTPAPDACRTGPRAVAKPGAPLHARPLAKDPNAAQLAAVWRRDHRGCPMPVVLKDDVGARR